MTPSPSSASASDGVAKRPQYFDVLEKLGRVRLSRSFFMRDFLYSEVSHAAGILNMPDDQDLAVSVGRKLCSELLEPLQEAFGRVAIRSAYRSCAVNEYGNAHGLNCGSNASNYAAHIWDRPSASGHGAMACVVIPWFADRHEAGADWRSMAYWIHNHLPYSRLQFFPKLCAFNIGWHEVPERAIQSYIEPKGYLLRGEPPKHELASYYEGFPSAVAM